MGKFEAGLHIYIYVTWRLIFSTLDELAPPSAIKLTNGGEGEGCVYVYDAETSKYSNPSFSDPLLVYLSSQANTRVGLMHPWVALYSAPVDDDEERDMNLDYFRAYIPSMSPREALQPLINRFRSLDYINRPPWAGTEHELVYEESAFPPPVRTDFRDESDFQSQEQARNEFLAKRHLKDLYLECGWNVNAVLQTAFRCEEFLEKRRQHLDTVYRHRLEEIRRRRQL
jgi:hypothetical protein